MKSLKNNTTGLKVLLTCLIMILFVGIPITNTEASTVKLNKTKITIGPKQTIKLKIKGSKKKVKWSSSKKKIATVNSKGKVKTLKTGTVTITAKIGKKKYKCKITVMSDTKLQKKLTAIYDYFVTFYSESTDISSVSSIKSSIKTLNKMTKKYSSFVNSLYGNKYSSFKKSYDNVVTQLQNIRNDLNELLNYYSINGYDTDSYQYESITDNMMMTC